jgi:shikimate kinase
MGAGKSAVGRALAKRLNRDFADLDREIEREAGRSVAEIFDREGEGRFRELERGCIGRWADRGAVVALGGGAIAETGAPQMLAEAGTVVYLKATPRTLLERVGDARTRPLLRDLDVETRLSEIVGMLDARRSAYESANIIVETDGRSISAVAEAVARELK